MPNDASNTGFQSVLAPFMDHFLQEKHACGYAYHEPIRIFTVRRVLGEEGLATWMPAIHRPNWLAKKPHESASNQQQRITIVRQFSKFFLQLASRVCARLDGRCSEIHFCAKNVKRRRTSEVLSCRRYV